MSVLANLQAPVAAHGLGTHRSLLYIATYSVLAVVTAPYRRAFQLYTWQPLREIRAAGIDPDFLIPLVREWKADKYAELQSVQVAATFCGGAVFSSLPLSRTANATWITDALWMASLICAISAIITGIQTKSLLDDLPSRQQLESSLSLPDVELQRMRRTILRYKRTPGIKHLIMMFIWQFPSMTMAYSWCFFLSGLTVYICTPFLQGLPWQDRHKIAITYLAVGFVGLATYLLSTIFVYVSEKDFERAYASTRTNTRYTTSEVEISRVAHSVDAQSSPANIAPGENLRRGISSIAESDDFIQAARARSLIGFRPDERSRRHTAGSAGGRSGRQLMF